MPAQIIEKRLLVARSIRRIDRRQSAKGRPTIQRIVALTAGVGERHFSCYDQRTAAKRGRAGRRHPKDDADNRSVRHAAKKSVVVAFTYSHPAFAGSITNLNLAPSWRYFIATSTSIHVGFTLTGYAVSWICMFHKGSQPWAGPPGEFA